MVGRLLAFYGISTCVGYLTSNSFYTNSQFYFKQFSLALVHSLIDKNISIDDHQVWSTGQDWVICLYIKIPKNFVHLIF